MSRVDLSSLTFSQIQIFLASAELLSFSEAAVKLHITQPLVSRTIAGLEEQFGFKLFLRKYRQLELTSAGKELQRKWTVLMSAAVDSIESAYSVYDAQMHTLNVFDDYMQENPPYFSQSIQRFKELHPEIRLHIEKTHPYEMSDAILKGEGDVGFIFEPELHRIPMEYFDFQKLGENKFCVMVNHSHPLAEYSSVTLKELSTIPIAIINKNNSSAYHETIINLFAEQGLAPTIISHVNSTASLLYACRMEGIPMIAHGYVSKEADFDYIPISDSTCSIYLIWKKGNKKPALRAFIADTCEAIKTI